LSEPRDRVGALAYPISRIVPHRALSHIGQSHPTDEALKNKAAHRRALHHGAPPAGAKGYRPVTSHRREPRTRPHESISIDVMGGIQVADASLARLR
jgi:hypothetical protein